MLTPKLLTFLMGMLLLLPFAITFWIMAFRNQDAEAKLKKAYDVAIADMEAQHQARLGSDQEYVEPIGVFMSVVAHDQITPPYVPYQLWTFYPRRWVGIVGLVCVFTMSTLWLLSSFVPGLTYDGEHQRTPLQETTTAPATPQK